MNNLLVSDLHLTDNPLDEYRWTLFPWLREQCRKNQVKTLFILGDLTEAKDRHSSRLVNRIVSELRKTYREAELIEIWILRGNHDGLDPGCPFFMFLGELPFIKYVSTPFQSPMGVARREVLLLPHTRNPVEDWQAVDLHGADIILMHATMKGSLGENGFALDGIPLSLLRQAHRAKIYSGDVHVPQRVGRVEYVGAPYPIKFGDDFQGRAILTDWRKESSLPFAPLARRTITIGPKYEHDALRKLVNKGDQVKVRIQLTPAEMGDWHDLKEDVTALCRELGVTLCGVELAKQESKALPEAKASRVALVRKPQDLLADYCKAAKIEKPLSDAGLLLLKESLGE